MKLTLLNEQYSYNKYDSNYNLWLAISINPVPSQVNLGQNSLITLLYTSPLLVLHKKYNCIITIGDWQIYIFYLKDKFQEMLLSPGILEK